MALDFPTFERPAKATSTPSSSGQCSGLDALKRYTHGLRRFFGIYSVVTNYGWFRFRVFYTKVVALILIFGRHFSQAGRLIYNDVLWIKSLRPNLLIWRTTQCPVRFSGNGFSSCPAVSVTFVYNKDIVKCAIKHLAMNLSYMPG